MNVLDFKPSPKVRRLARQLFAEASENELEITNDVGEIASVLKAEIVGLENKFKTENSLARKLSDYSQEKICQSKLLPNALMMFCVTHTCFRKIDMPKD